MANGQFVPLAVQFENIGENLAFPIAELITVGDPAGAASLGTQADQIWLWDTTAADWKKYFYRVQRGVVTGWCKQGETTATADTIAAGATFFFYRGGSSTTSITLAGAVKGSTGTSTATLANGQFAFVSFPWPVEFTIANTATYYTTGEAAGAASLGTQADQIWLWDTTVADWVKYFYRVQRGVVTGWCKQGETTATTDTIPVGKGFFFYRGGSATATITFTAPEGL